MAVGLRGRWRVKFFIGLRDRIGPDNILTHWMLHSKFLMRILCRSKFRAFDQTSELRPGSYAITCSKISLGKNVVIRPGTMLFADSRDSRDGSIFIEDNVMIGSGVHVYVANHRYDIKGLNIIDQGHCPGKDVILREGCWVGANSIILPGVEVGMRSVIAAGSIVTRSVPNNTVFAGNPARLVKKTTE